MNLPPLPSPAPLGVGVNGPHAVLAIRINGQLLQVPLPAPNALQFAGRFVECAIEAAQNAAIEEIKSACCADCTLRIARTQRAKEEAAATATAKHEAALAAARNGTPQNPKIVLKG